jgi:outer membrane protein assembly factor BamB
LVVDGRVIVFGGGEEGHSLAAYDAATGAPVWRRAGGKQSYSSPHLLTIRGERQILMHDNRALASYSVEDGELLWERLNGSEIAIPMLQPHLVGEAQLVTSDDPGIALVDLEHAGADWTLTDRWTSKSLKPSFNDFAIHERHIYGLDDGILCCVELETGKRIWKKGRYGHGQMLLIADQGLLVVLSEKGEVVLVAANSERHEELGRFQAIEGKTWNHPAIAHGRLYVRNGEEMACYQLSPAGAAQGVARVER